jgi:hypothetical protein
MAAQAAGSPDQPERGGDGPYRGQDAPDHPGLPRKPAAMATGRCVGHPQPWLWTSSDPEEREAAIWICQACPALLACREWSVCLSPLDTAIYGGLTSFARIALRRQRQREAGQNPPEARCPGCGSPLARGTCHVCRLRRHREAERRARARGDRQPPVQRELA